MEKTWRELYQEEIDSVGEEVYFKQKIKHKKPLIRLIEKYSPNKTVIETGCGSAVVSTYLASLGYKVSCVDIDKDIIDLAKTFTITKDNPKFILGDIKNLQTDSHYDVSFSNGVFEHFSDEDIKQIIESCKKISNFGVVGIPTKFFTREEAMYGNERYLSKKEWIEIFTKANVTILETKTNDYRGWVKQIIQIKKWFKPKPFLIFVLKFN